MLKLLAMTALLCALPLCAAAEVLIVADEFPAMEILGKRLKTDAGMDSRIVEQVHMPKELSEFKAVVVYIHKALNPPAERAFIDYAENGGRLVLLHHSISSGKRQNRDWFSFLGVQLPEGDVERGGYKWIEGVTVDWVNLSGHHPVMTNGIHYARQIPYARSDGSSSKPLDAFTLKDTEVYLNHVLKGPHRLLMGLMYTDTRTGKTWMQESAGWYRLAGKGWIIYFMPGHTLHDFENATYGRIVVNAISAQAEVFQ